MSLLAALLVLPLAGCERAVEASVPDRADTAACTAASRHWPSTVGGEESRDVSVDSPAVRAWGDPAVIARCGLSSPGPTTDDCIDVSGVDWVAHHLDGGGMAFVTYGRSPAIEVLIPKEYSPQPLLLPAFAKAAKQIPQGEHRCSAPS